MDTGYTLGNICINCAKLQIGILKTTAQKERPPGALIDAGQAPANSAYLAPGTLPSIPFT
jgi:hypothetical protein